MLKAVLFDLDNTLIDFMRMKQSCARASAEAMVKAGLNLGVDEAYSELMRIYWEVGIEHETIFQEFLKRVKKDVDYKILAAGIVAYQRQQPLVMRPYDGVVESLARLKSLGLKLGVVSDAKKLRAWKRLTELGLQDSFDAVVTFDDTGHHKPSELPFRKALRSLDCSPGEALMVGDWPERDILGAKALGMKTCFARYGWQIGWRQEKETPSLASSGADFEIASFSQIVDIAIRIRGSGP